MLSFTTKAIVIFLAVFMFFSCDESEVSNNFDIVVSNNLKLGEDITVTVNEKDKLINYKWVLKYELGNNVTSCQNLEVSNIECSLEESGEMSIKLSAQTRNGKDIVLTKVVKILNMDLPQNQSPVIILSLKSENGDESVASTDRTKEEGTFSYPVNEEIAFDFSKTTDDNNLNSELKYEVQFGSNAAFQAIADPANFNHTFTKTGLINVSLRITDKDENSAIKSFYLYISCKEGEVDLDVDSDKITITKEAVHNFFTYSASNAVTGGDANTYRFKWDYNGDGIYDTDWIKEDTIKEYTVFKGEREVRLKVWEQGCNNVEEVDVDYNFDMPWADAIPANLQGPQIPGYFFIQGHPAGKNNFKSTVTDVDFIATKSNTAPANEQWRVLCDYRENSETATISIKGLNEYEKDVDGVLHGVLLKMDDIDVSGSLNNLKAEVNKFSYYSDEGYDKISRETYDKADENHGCVSQVTLIKKAGEGVCYDGKTETSEVILIDGTFSCENMTGRVNKETISFKKGAFYCEVGIGDACVGGGGGGGGNPPEEF